jgi:hypothetical protein
MTIDVEAESAIVDWPVAYTNLWDRYIALCDALDAEREKVRVLATALRDAMRHTHAVPMAAFDEWMDALAATDDGGGA